MTEFHYMLWPDGSWCDMANATDYLKQTEIWMEVTGNTSFNQIANHLENEKQLGGILADMFGVEDDES